MLHPKDCFCFAGWVLAHRGRLAFLAAAFLAIAAQPVRAEVLSHVSVSIQNSGGSGGAGASTSDMIYDRYTSGDGWGWAGGAGGVQGSLAVTNNGGNSIPANETFKFNLGAAVDSLNATYGAGDWTVANPKLDFASSYSIQNNSRFGRGSGDFDIFWVANDDWAQSRGTVDDRQLNPVYATTAATLLPWAGSEALLGSEYFDATGSGYVNLSYDLSLDALFVNDIVTASASGLNKALSLYLMAKSDTLGMIIFTGGQGQILPTLSFDVVAVPEPASLALLAICGAGLLIWRRPRLAPWRRASLST